VGHHYEGFPETLRVGAWDVQVQVLDRINLTNADDWGAYSGSQCLLQLRRDQPGAAFAVDTALHEIIHAIFNAYDISKKDDEERIVTRLATVMTQVLRDNPRLVKWIAGALA
jgi:hypothetical protein